MFQSSLPRQYFDGRGCSRSIPYQRSTFSISDMMAYQPFAYTWQPNISVLSNQAVVVAHINHSFDTWLGLSISRSLHFELQLVDIIYFRLSGVPFTYSSTALESSVGSVITWKGVAAPYTQNISLFGSFIFGRAMQHHGYGIFPIQHS